MPNAECRMPNADGTARFSAARRVMKDDATVSHTLCAPLGIDRVGARRATDDTDGNVVKCMPMELARRTGFEVHVEDANPRVLEHCPVPGLLFDGDDGLSQKRHADGGQGERAHLHRRQRGRRRVGRRGRRNSQTIWTHHASPTTPSQLVVHVRLRLSRLMPSHRAISNRAADTITRGELAPASRFERSLTPHVTPVRPRRAVLPRRWIEERQRPVRV